MRFGIDRASGKLAVGPASIPMPGSKWGRVSIGAALMLFGLLGFLPVLGFWMLPLGFLVLSNELPQARRLRRRISLWWGRRKSVKA
jgi:Putative transmembrane protein (PGPGW).